MHLVGVGDELGDSFLVFLAGVLEDADSALNLGLLALVLDDAPHGVGDVLPGVGVLLVEDGVPVVESAAEVAVFVLQGCDGAVDAGDVVDDALVVVDDGLDRSVAVVAAGGAAALSLGGHCRVVLPDWWGGAVRIVGMDSQLLSNLSFWVSVFAAASSFVFALLAWFHSYGSKKARDKAEAAHQAALEMRDAAVRAAKAAEEHARQVEQIVAEQQKQSESQAEIASHLWRPTFELTPDRGDSYLLRNVTNESVEILEVANLDEFVRCGQVQQVFRPGESLRIFMFGASGKPLPSNLELRIRGVDEVVPVPIRR